MLLKNIVNRKILGNSLTPLNFSFLFAKAKLKTRNAVVRVCECFQNHKLALNKPCMYNSYGEGHGGPLRSSRLENPMDRRVYFDCSPWGRRESHELKQLSIYTYNSQTSARINVT